MNKIFHYLYSSLASNYISEQTLSDILRVARRNNGSLQISGLLLYRTGHFIQLLEGEEQKVLEIYEKIKGDSRHQHIKTLAQFHSPSKLFGTWNMGHIQDEKQTEEIFKKLNLVLEKPLEIDENIKALVIQVLQQVSKTTIS